MIGPIWSNVLLAFWSILLIHENLVKAASHLNTALGASFYLAKVWWIIAANSAAVFFSFAGVGLARPWRSSVSDVVGTSVGAAIGQSGSIGNPSVCLPSQIFYWGSLGESRS